MLLAIVLCAALVGVYAVSRLGLMKDWFDGATTVQTTTRTVSTTTAYRILSDKPKLVVLTPSLDVMLTRSSETRVLWGKLDLGTTIVRLEAHDNRVQYIVPLEELTESDLQYDAARNVLTVVAPAPRVDDMLVEVQSDPSKIEIETDNGWLKLDRYSGKPLREEAKAQLREAVLKQSDKPMINEQARASAAQAITALLRSPLANIPEDVSIEVKFRNPPTRTATADANSNADADENREMKTSVTVGSVSVSDSDNSDKNPPLHQEADKQ